MNTKNNNLEKRIMWQVYLIWFVKKAVPRFVAELAAFSVFVYLISRQVFIAKVLQYAEQILGNSSISPTVWASFIFNTFAQTEFIVQLSVVGSLLAVILVFKTFIASVVQLALAKNETNLARPSL